MLRTVLRITSTYLRNSYVVIICATLLTIHLRNSYVVTIWARSCQTLTKSKHWVKLKSVRTLLRIACSANRKSYLRRHYRTCQLMWKVDQKWKCIKLKSLYVLIPSKVDQKRNWVKLKLVRTLISIACLADRKSYVIIICASSCEKLTKSEIGSSWRRFKYCYKSLP